MLKFRKTRTYCSGIVQKAPFSSEAQLIGFPIGSEWLTSRAGVLDNVHRERDTVFTEQGIEERIRSIIAALIAENKAENDLREDV